MAKIDGEEGAHETASNALQTHLSEERSIELITVCSVQKLGQY
jgi:hypothetical protein